MRDGAANPAATLDRLLEALMEPIGRKARRRAVKAIGYGLRNGSRSG